MSFAKSVNGNIIKARGENVLTLPKVDKAVIPPEKLTKYALNPDKDPDKAIAFAFASAFIIVAKTLGVTRTA